MNLKQYSTPTLLALTGLLLLPIPAFAFFESLLWGIVVSVLGTAVGLAGNLLDYAVNTFVIDFGTQYQQNGIGVAVDTTWVVIRDFINMSFIFGLVYIGIKMILDSDSSNTRRWLVNLIIAALLINFSLFFTKFVIDVSNQFATAIASEGFQTQQDGSGVDISQALVDKLGINTVFNKATDTYQGTGYAYIFGTALILIIATFVFAAGAIMLIIRFVALNLFLVFSPVMFLSFILPPLQNISRDYWRKFLGRAFFAPLYLLFIYISFTILDAMSQTGAIQNAEFGNYLATGGRALITNNNNSNPFAFFIFASILLIASLVVSNKLGADGASKAVSMGKDLSNRAQRSTTRFAQNTGKFAAAQTGGRAARGLSNWGGGKLDNALRRAQQLEGTGRVARVTRSVARWNGTQDVIGGAAKSMQDAKFGLKRTVDEENKLSRQTNTNANNAMALQSGLAVNRAREEEERRRIAAGQAAGAIEVERNGVRMFVADENQLTDEEKNARKVQDKKISDMQRIAAEMSLKEFEDMFDHMTEDDQKDFAQFMGGSLTESVMKSDNISDEQKEKIGKAQAEAVKKTIMEGEEVIAENLNKLTIRQIEALGDEFIAQNAHLFNDSIFSDIKKSKKFTESQVNKFSSNRATAFKKLSQGNEDDAEKIFKQTYRDPNTGKIERKKRKASEIAKLSGDVLMQPNSIKYITVDVLKSIANSDRDFERVTSDQREKIAEMIRFENDRHLGNDPELKKAVDYLKSIQGQRDFVRSK